MKQSSAVTAALGEHKITITITRSFGSERYGIGSSTTHPTGSRMLSTGQQERDPRLAVLDAVQHFMDSTSAQIRAATEFLTVTNDSSAASYASPLSRHEMFLNALADLERLAAQDALPPAKDESEKKTVPAHLREKPAAAEYDTYLLGVGAGRLDALLQKGKGMTGDSITRGAPVINEFGREIVDGMTIADALKPAPKKTRKKTRKKAKRKTAPKPNWR
jgi:hypothetical protein